MTPFIVPDLPDSVNPDNTTLQGAVGGDQPRWPQVKTPIKARTAFRNKEQFLPIFDSDEENPALAGAKQKLYRLIERRCNMRGYCDRDVPEFAESTRKTQATIIEYLRQMAADELISVYKRRNGAKVIVLHTEEGWAAQNQLRLDDESVAARAKAAAERAKARRAERKAQAEQAKAATEPAKTPRTQAKLSELDQKNLAEPQKNFTENRRNLGSEPSKIAENPTKVEPNPKNFGPVEHDDAQSKDTSEFRISEAENLKNQQQHSEALTQSSAPAANRRAAYKDRVAAVVVSSFDSFDSDFREDSDLAWDDEGYKDEEADWKAETARKTISEMCDGMRRIGTALPTRFASPAPSTGDAADADLVWSGARDTIVSRPTIAPRPAPKLIAPSVAPVVPCDDDLKSWLLSQRIAPRNADAYLANGRALVGMWREAWPEEVKKVRKQGGGYLKHMLDIEQFPPSLAEAAQRKEAVEEAARKRAQNRESGAARDAQSEDVAAQVKKYLDALSAEESAEITDQARKRCPAAGVKWQERMKKSIVRERLGLAKIALDA